MGIFSASGKVEYPRSLSTEESLNSSVTLYLKQGPYIITGNAVSGNTLVALKHILVLSF